MFFHYFLTYRYIVESVSILPAVCPLPPDADGLVLIGQVVAVAVVEVVSAHDAGHVAKEVLGAPHRGQVRVVTAQLGHLI